MLRGIGVDMVSVSEIAALTQRLSAGALARLFTAGELAAAQAAPRPHEYLAARFAAKEAVFKAMAHLLPEKQFDLRIVETLHRADGSPYIRTDGPLCPVLEQAGVHRLLLSVTTEGDLATAFVVAE